MSVSEVVEDLNTLRRLAGEEVDQARRRALETMRRRLADRGRGRRSPKRRTCWASVPRRFAPGSKPGCSKRRQAVARRSTWTSSDSRTSRIVNMLRAEGQHRDLLRSVSEPSRQ